MPYSNSLTDKEWEIIEPLLPPKKQTRPGVAEFRYDEKIYPPSGDRQLISSFFHLPYNSDLIERAKELRKNMTPAEKKLWHEYLRNFPKRVLRQRPIDRFIVDFYCAELKLVIEVDGDSHFTEEAQEYDRQRTKILEKYQLQVIRFTNNQVFNNFPVVCERIEEFLIGFK